MNKTKLILFTIIALCLNSCDSRGQNGDVDRILFKDEKGNQIAMSDLEDVTRNYNWEIKEDTKVPKKANRLHQEARQHGGKGEYDLGINKLLEASEIAPNWAYPIYDLGYTYLLKQDFQNALKYYEMTDKMKPRGFFTAKTAYWSLKNENEGIYPEGLYSAFMQIEWMNSVEEKLTFAKAIVDKYPKYAPAWKTIASNSESIEDRLLATNNGLNCDPDLETKGQLLINMALLKNMENQTEEATKILGELIFNEETTLANIEMAKFVLSTIVNGI